MICLLAGCASAGPSAQERAPAVTPIGAGGPPSTVAPPPTAPATSGAPPATPTTAPPAQVTPTTIQPSGTVSPSGTVPATGSSTTNAGCGALAARTFIHVLSVEPGPDDSLFLHGNPATLHCGGPDDSQLIVDTTRTETGEVLADATVQVFPLSGMRLRPIDPGRLSAYLTGDGGTRTFLVSGPLTAMTGIQEQFHP